MNLKNKPWRPNNWGECLDEAQDDRIGIGWLSDCAYKELMEIGADAMLKALKIEIPKHLCFWANCQRQKVKPAKICIDCPFILAGVIPNGR